MNRGQRQAVQKGQVGHEVRRLTRRWLSMPLGPALGLPQHLDQHRPECPVLLAVDQLRKLVSGVLYVGWLGSRVVPLYPCFSTSVSSTTLSTISTAMYSAMPRSPSFLWATSTRAACQADQ